MNRSATIASFLLRRLVPTPSRPYISTRSIATVHFASLHPNLQIPRPLSPSVLNPARGFAGRRHELDEDDIELALRTNSSDFEDVLDEINGGDDSDDGDDDDGDYFDDDDDDDVDDDE